MEDDTLHDIFGGDSDLSDVEEERQQQQPAPAYREESPSDGDDDDGGLADERDEDYAQPPTGAGAGPEGAGQRADASEGQGRRPTKLPKIKKSKGLPRDVDTEPKRRKPRRKPTEGEGEHETAPAEELELDPAELRRRELNAQIELAARGGRKPRKRKRHNDEDLDLLADEEVAQLRQNMMAAAQQDAEANEERRPATAKIVMLPTVVLTMQKSHLESSILDNQVLDAVRRWLEPLPDKSLPALNIQRSLFQLLLKMNIDTPTLKGSDLGKITLFYTKCKRVEPSIKRMADELVMTWMRPIISRSANYRHRRAPAPVSDPTTVSRPLAAGSAPPGSQSIRARVPETNRRAYDPGAGVDDDGGAGPGEDDAVLSRSGTQRATIKKSREWTRKLAEAKRGARRGL